MEIVAAIIGPCMAAVFGTAAFMQRRVLMTTDTKIHQLSDQVEEIYDQVTAIRVSLPAHYVSREDFLHHVRTEEHWQEQVMNEIRNVREEVIVLRVQGGGHHNVN